MPKQSEAHYDLLWIQQRVKEDGCTVPKRVERYLRHKGYPLNTPALVIGRLDTTDHHKTQKHESRPDVWLDVYRPMVDGIRWYVKITLSEDESIPLVLSCCRDGEAH